MNQQTRNESERFCALAEIEDPEKFAEIIRGIDRLLAEKQTRLSRQRPANRVPYPAAPPNVA